MSETGTIQVRCACGRKLTAPAGSEGKKARCPACGAKIVIGSQATAPRQTAAAKTPAAANRSSANSASSSSSSTGPNRATAVAAKARANAGVAVAPAPAPAPPANEDNDRFKALYEVADEMEAAPAAEVPRCPQCHSPMAGGAVLCVTCGYDSRTGQRLTTAALEQPKSGLLPGRGGKKKVEDRMSAAGSFGMGLLLSAVFALAASLVWIGFAWLTGFSIGYIAMLIGAAAGVGMQIGHRGYSSKGGYAAAAMTLVAILAAKFAVLVLVIMPRITQYRTISDLSGARLGLYFFSPIGWIIMLFGMGIAYKTANGSSSD
jgi:DNA-directed RNA polymerase subunit RPC12/RpoP